MRGHEPRSYDLDMLKVGGVYTESHGGQIQDGRVGQFVR